MPSQKDPICTCCLHTPFLPSLPLHCPPSYPPQPKYISNDLQAAQTKSTSGRRKIMSSSSTPMRRYASVSRMRFGKIRVPLALEVYIHPLSFPLLPPPSFPTKPGQTKQILTLASRKRRARQQSYNPSRQRQEEEQSLLTHRQYGRCRHGANPMVGW